MKNHTSPSENISTKDGAFSSSRVPIRHQFFNWKWKLLKFPLKVRSYFIAFFQLRQLLITSLDKQNSCKPRNFFGKKRKIFIPRLRGSINKFFAKRRIFIIFFIFGNLKKRLKLYEMKYFCTGIAKGKKISKAIYCVLNSILSWVFPKEKGSDFCTFFW